MGVNAGKAIAAYERQLTCGPSAFDASMHGGAPLSAQAAPLTVVNVNAPAVNCVFATNCINVVTAGKHPSPQWLPIDAAVRH